MRRPSGSLVFWAHSRHTDSIIRFLRTRPMMAIGFLVFAAEALLWWRVGLQTSRVTASGPDLVVPYAALIYDKQGKSWVYTVSRPLTYLRVSVVVKEEVDEDSMALSAGPPAGTEVVTRGATEVYGAELGMDGNH